LCIGLENVIDLQNDIARALKAANL
jgi:cystathionine beta-lyase/cystathionine gamma-synthase